MRVICSDFTSVESIVDSAGVLAQLEALIVRSEPGI